MINKFIRAHPNHPAMDYALLLLEELFYLKIKGLLKKLSMQDISDRDIYQLSQSFNAFKEINHKISE